MWYSPSMQTYWIRLVWVNIVDRVLARNRVPSSRYQLNWWWKIWHSQIVIKACDTEEGTPEVKSITRNRFHSSSRNFFFPLYWPYYAVRLFLHIHLQQSIEPSMPRNLKAFPCRSSSSNLLLFEGHRYWYLYIITTWAANCFIQSLYILLPILPYSSTATEHVPCASLRMAAMNFWYAFRHTFPVASFLVVKNSTRFLSLWHMQRNIARDTM